MQEGAGGGGGSAGGVSQQTGAQPVARTLAPRAPLHRPSLTSEREHPGSNKWQQQVGHGACVVWSRDRAGSFSRVEMLTNEGNSCRCK